MNREELIKKWLDNELNPSEFEAFNKLEDAEELTKISNAIKRFKAPEYNSEKEFEAVNSIIKTKKNKSSQLIKQLFKVAAILILGFSIFYYTTTLDTTFETDYAENIMIELPDASSVTINALSKVKYNKNNWKQAREINLNGEAYFKVTKGSTFKVTTPNGTVTVLGTEFKVKQRDNYFEVVCYEGSVEVVNNSNKKILGVGDSYLLIDGKLIATEKEKLPQPSWINEQSYFKSIPFKFVLNEFERQYNVTIDAKNVDVNKLYTGNFSHKDIDLALKSITLPLNLKYSINNSNVYLTRE